MEMGAKPEIRVEHRGGRTYASSGARWEPVVGYSRAVRVGNTIAVTGTVGIEADGSYAEEMEAQTLRALEIVLAALEALGATRTDVVRTRIFVTDISRWEEAGRAHGEVFGDVRPATTMVEVRRLIDDRALVEIEADAIVG